MTQEEAIQQVEAIKANITCSCQNTRDWATSVRIQKRMETVDGAEEDAEKNFCDHKPVVGEIRVIADYPDWRPLLIWGVETDWVSVIPFSKYDFPAFEYELKLAESKCLHGSVLEAWNGISLELSCFDHSWKVGELSKEEQADLCTLVQAYFYCLHPSSNLSTRVGAPTSTMSDEVLLTFIPYCIEESMLFSNTDYRTVSSSMMLDHLQSLIQRFLLK